MFERPLSRSALVAAFLGCALVASAQLTTNGPALQRLSRSLTKQSQAEAQIAQAWASANGIPLRRNLADGGLIVLQGWSNGAPRFIGTEGFFAAQTISADHVWPGGSSALNLTGSGITLGLWEAGGNPEASHREFTNRITIQDGNTFASDHATHVAGIMIAAGVDARARGMSYGASINGWDASNDRGEAAAAAARGIQPIRASNHSYGAILGWRFGALGDDKYVWFGDTRISAVEDYRFGFYDSGAAAWDTIAYNAPYYLVIGSAGNNRDTAPLTQPDAHWVYDFATNAWVESSDVRSPNDSFDTMNGDFKVAKNTLAVGAVEEIPGGYNDPNSVVMASFSNWGPTDDGRIKPDLVAAGVDVFSSVNNNGYAQFSGTSMAAPGVTGGAGLLMQYYRSTHGGADMRASTLKALLIQTADEAGDNDGPDYSFGWGLTNINRAAQVLQNAIFNPTTIREAVLTSGETIDIPVAVDNTGGPMKVTIAWTDPAGTPVAPVLDPITSMLVNDLDLRVIRNSNSTIYQPWILNPATPAAAATTGDNVRDNVEQVVIVAPNAGVHTIRISHKGSLRGGSQVVSVIVTAPQPSGFSGLDLTPDTVVGGAENAVGTLTVTEVSPTPTAVDLYSSNPSVASVPSSITVPANATAVDFPVITRSVRPNNGDSSVPVTIIATSAIGSRSGILNVLPILVADFTLSSDSIVGGNTVTGTVTLNAPAPTSGAAVSITTNLPKVARSVRNWVTIRRGETTASFTIRTFPVPEAKDVIITASRLGNSVPQSLAVGRPGISALTATPTAVTGRNPFSLKIEMNGPAPTNGAIVQLSSSNPLLLGVPASVTISAGKTFTTISLTPTSAGGGAQVTITATRFSATTATTVTLN